MFDRELFFHNYWKMGDSHIQKYFIPGHVKAKSTNRKTQDGKRKKTLEYFLTISDNRVKVCKAVFLKTLGIREKTVYYTTRNILVQARQALTGVVVILQASRHQMNFGKQLDHISLCSLPLSHTMRGVRRRRISG